MKKLLISALAVVLSLSVASMAQEKVVAKKEDVRVVRINVNEQPDLYLQWALICAEMKEQKLKKARVDFKKFEVEIKCIEK